MNRFSKLFIYCVIIGSVAMLNLAIHNKSTANAAISPVGGYIIVSYNDCKLKIPSTVEFFQNLTWEEFTNVSNVLSIVSNVLVGPEVRDIIIERSKIEEIEGVSIDCG